MGAYTPSLGRCLIHPPDVLEPRPELLRALRQQLREQVPLLARRGLRHAMRRQAHEGITAVRRPLPGAERCHGTTRRHAGQVILSRLKSRFGGIWQYHANKQRVLTGITAPTFAALRHLRAPEARGVKISVQYWDGTRYRSLHILTALAARNKYCVQACSC